MKNVFIVEFISEKGTHYIVKKAFPTREKAEQYASHQTGILNHFEIENIQTTSISKLEIVY